MVAALACLAAGAPAHAQTVAPGVPTGLTVTEGHHTVRLDWTAPASDGGSPITGYYIFESTSAITNFLSGTGTSYIEFGLPDRDDYSFQVAASNVDFRGPYTTAVAGVVGPAEVRIEALGATAVEGGFVDFTVYTTRPELSSSKPLSVSIAVSETGDMVVSGDGGARTVNFSTGSSFTEKNLSVRTALDSVAEQDSVVTATINAHATGDYTLGSPASDQVTVRDDDSASAPTGLTATEGHHTARLDWTVPASDGGSAITTYDVTWNGGSSHLSTNSANTWWIDDDPDQIPGNYPYQVRAVTANGDGAWSSVVRAVVGPATVRIGRSVDPVVNEGDFVGFNLYSDKPPLRSSSPLAVIVTVSETGGSMVPVAEQGQRAVTFSLSSAEENFGFATIDDPTEVDSVVTATINPNSSSDYTVGSPASDQVTVRDDDGNAAPTGQPTISGTPRVGQRLTAGPGDIADADGLNNVSYSYQWQADQADIPGAIATSLDLTDDHKGAMIRVAASFTDDGGSAETVYSDAVGPVLGVPDAPTNLSAQAGDRQVALNWDAPANTGGTAITGYQFRRDSGGWQNTGSTATSYTVTNLNNGTEYRFRVRARNAQGSSAESGEVRATPAAGPHISIAGGGPVEEGEAARFTLTRTGHDGASLNVSVTVSESQDMVQPSGEGTRSVSFASNAGTATLSVATRNDSVDEPDSVVTVTLQAVTGYSLGPAATVRVRDNDELPRAPGSVSARRTEEGDYQLSWSAPSNTGSSSITGYEIDRSLDGGANWARRASPGANATSFTDATVAPEGRAHYRVRALTAVGPSPWASTIRRSDGGSASPPCTGPLRLALWTDLAGYRPGDTLRLYRTAQRNCDRDAFLTFYYLESIETGERRYFAPGIRSTELQTGPLDYRGRGPGGYQARQVAEAEKELTWEGAVPEPGLWRFVLELRGESADSEARRFLAPFVVVERSQLLIRRNLEREVAGELDLRADTLYYLLGRLRVVAGGTLRLEAGTLVRAWGRGAEIVVDPGGRIEAAGTADAPVVLTCTSPPGERSAGCWAGLRLHGRAPVTGLEVPAPAGSPPVPGEAGNGSGELRWVRVEFAGAAPQDGGPTPAVLVRGADSGTVIEHVQAHASLGHGFLFDGGSAACQHCVASGPGQAGLAWDRGWQGAARHLFVQHGPGGQDGIVGGSGGDSVDAEPRSRPELSNVTLIHSAPYSRESRRAVGLRLAGGTAVAARDLVVTGFAGGALRAGPRAALLFGEEGGSSVADAILRRNGLRSGQGQLRGGILTGVAFRDVDPRLRNPRYWPNPDPRPTAGSPALKTGAAAAALPEGEPAYIGAFGKRDWLHGWTFFGAESDYDLREVDE